jgi:uncharacterized protein
MLFMLSALVAASAQAPAPTCLDGTFGSGPRTRRVILESVEQNRWTAHVYSRPARTASLTHSSGAWFVSNDGAVTVEMSSDSTATFTLATARDTLRATLARTASHMPDREIAGEWIAPVGPGGVIRLIARLSIGPCGLLVGIFDSPDQGQTELPITAARVTRDSVVLEAAYIGLRIAFPTAGTDQRNGRMTQNGVESTIVISRGASARLNRPQEPKRPFPYAEYEARFGSAATGINLVGTLTIPEGPGPHPAIVLISGSGAQDRDETVAGHKPFLVLSDYLTRRGIAVLRADDRGAAGTKGNPLNTRLQDVADVVRGALAWLRTRPDIDARRIGLLGHSEGAFVAPMVAADDPAIAFLVILGGPAARGRDLLVAQRSALVRASSESLAATRVDSLMIERLFRVLDQRPADNVLGATLDSAVTNWLAELSPEDRAIATAALSARTAQQDSTSIVFWQSPWFKSIYYHDPAPILRRINRPVLAIFGDLDLQVPTALNAKGLEAAFGAARRHLLTIHRLPGVNHMMQRARTGMMEEYLTIEETMSPDVLERIIAWLKIQR